jgi:hypothetical protein
VAAACATRGGVSSHDADPPAIATGRLAVREWAGRAELMRYAVGEVSAVH